MKGYDKLVYSGNELYLNIVQMNKVIVSDLLNFAKNKLELYLSFILSKNGDNSLFTQQTRGI